MAPLSMSAPGEVSAEVEEGIPAVPRGTDSALVDGVQSGRAGQHVAKSQIYTGTRGSAHIKGPFTGITCSTGCFNIEGSILQALYATPEFRAALYQWEWESERGETKGVSIPYQLQRLFCQMQIAESQECPRNTVDARQLRESLYAAGCTGDSEDIFCFLLESLEDRFAATRVAGAMSSLFDIQGQRYVRCIECGDGSSCDARVRSINIAVRPFGSASIRSVEEGLDNFFAPEHLTEYACARCDRYVDALVGMSLQRAPCILMVSVPRFDYDWEKYTRIVVRDRVSFPETLDMAKHLLRSAKPPAVQVGSACEVAAGAEASWQKANLPMCGGSLLDQTGAATHAAGAAVAEQTSYLAMVLAAPVTPRTRHVLPLQMAQRRLAFGMSLRSGGLQGGALEIDTDVAHEVGKFVGRFLYDLCAILTYKGSGQYGHYSTYVRDFAKNQWFTIVDGHVHGPLTTAEWQRTFGDGTQTSPLAYKLIYHHRDPCANITHVPDSHLPVQVMADLERGA